MPRTFEVIYDGNVFRPETPPDLQPNTRCVISIQEVLPEASSGSAWDVLESLTGTVEAPDDWAAEHDHYLYGTPKRTGKGPQPE
jgi:hypothetical protein